MKNFLLDLLEAFVSKKFIFRPDCERKRISEMITHNLNKKTQKSKLIEITAKTKLLLTNNVVSDE